MKKDILTRPSNITAKVICDSISPSGKRITTLEIEYPRFIHCELLTHGMLCVNSSSSRAVPVERMSDQLKAVPLYWGSKQSGMQAGGEIDAQVFTYQFVDRPYLDFREVAWQDACDHMEEYANSFQASGYHKQIANRLTEPFQMMKTVVTATEWNNFFNLRLHPMAQPEFIRLAYEMYKEIEGSTPMQLRAGEWHTPYVHKFKSSTGRLIYSDGIHPVNGGRELTEEQAVKISCASCAQVSYRKLDQSEDAIERIFNRLINDDILHGSAFAHTAKCMSSGVGSHPYYWEDGVSHMTKGGELWSGQYKGWIQYRKLLPNENCTSFNFEERMKLFED